MTAYFRFVLQYRWAVIAVILAITALSAYSFSSAIIATSITKMFFGDAPEYRQYQEKVRQFANDIVFVIAYEDPSPLSRASLDRLDKVIRRIEAMPEVARTDSLLNAQRIWAEGDDLHIERYGALARATSSKNEALLSTLKTDPLASGLLVSGDGRHAAVIVELTAEHDRRAEQTPQLLGKVLAAFERAGYPARTLHRSGIPTLMAELVNQTYYNLQRLFPISAMVLLGVVFVLFRRLTPALLAVLVCSLAVSWTMGFARLLDRELSIAMSVVPSVVLIVAFSDVIHLWSAYLLERGLGKPKQEAILASASDVGKACLLTSATTFVGFVCLSAIPTPMFRIMGLVLGFGVAVALLLAMTLTPITISLMQSPGHGGSSRAASLERGWLPGILRALAKISTSRPWLVIGLFIVVMAVSVAGMLRLEIETVLADRIDPKTDFRKDQAFFEKNFHGTNMLECFVETDAKEGLLEPAVLKRITALQDRLQKHPNVDSVVSLVTLLRTMHQTLGGKGDMPTTRAAIAQYLLLFEMSGGKELERLVDFDRRSMRLAVRLNVYGARESYTTGQAADKIGKELLHGKAGVTVTSMSFLLGWWLDSIIVGQRNGLMISIVVIALMMVIGLRSVRVGLLSMIPNLLPLMTLAGLLGVTWQRVDSDTLVIAIMAIGIGVDDTIHFLMRYRMERQRCADKAEALDRTFAFSGRGIVLTTVVLVAGFLPFAMSNYYSVRIMGTLLPGVLVTALLADLLLVPALVQVGMLDSPRRAGGRPER